LPFSAYFLGCQKKFDFDINRKLVLSGGKWCIFTHEQKYHVTMPLLLKAPVSAFKWIFFPFLVLNLWMAQLTKAIFTSLLKGFVILKNS